MILVILCSIALFLSSVGSYVQTIQHGRPLNTYTLFTFVFLLVLKDLSTRL